MEGCNAVGTLGHLLSSCPQQLDRYSYRHDSILLHLVTSIHRMKKENIEVYADLPGWQTNGGTVPHNMAMTEQRPDLVIINRERVPTKITLVELTCCWDSKGAFRAALERKSDRYERLVDDLKENGLNASMVALEIGCRGVVDLRNNANIEGICNEVGIRAIKKMRGALGRLALIGSFRIWLAQSSQQWSPGELLSVKM